MQKMYLAVITYSQLFSSLKLLWVCHVGIHSQRVLNFHQLKKPFNEKHQSVWERVILFHS